MLFEVGELVRIQNPKNKEWDSKGVIEAIRIANDGRVLSYDINLTNGGTTVRHRKYLMRVVIRAPTITGNQRVLFAKVQIRNRSCSGCNRRLF